MLSRACARLLVAVLLTFPAAAVADTPVSRRDDAFHHAFFRDGQHDGAYAEWWYFNLFDAAQGVQLAFGYSVIDPSNLTDVGVASTLAVVYSPQGNFQQAAYVDPAGFFASYEQADVLVAANPSGGGWIRVLDDDRYWIAGAVAGEHRVTWNLLYVRQAASWFAGDRQHVGVEPWEQMSWLVYMPGASVTGTVTVDGHPYVLTNARGYHDHNWGEWIPSNVLWNWAQYYQPGLAIALGDFRGSPVGDLGVDLFGERTVFDKTQYRLVHTAWGYDPVHRRWFPTSSILYAANDEVALVINFEATATQAILPPVPLLLIPVLYEQTATVSGAVWKKLPSGGWDLHVAFAGGGFKEFTTLRPLVF